MKRVLQSRARTLITKLRHIFLGSEERVFESALAPEDLKRQIRQGLGGWLFSAPGPTGYVLGSSVNLGWSYGRVMNRPITTFHGRLETTPTGSRLRGRFAANRFAQAFCAVWFGGVLLFSLLFVWTLLFPAFGFCLMWLGAHLMAWGTEDAEQNIRGYLTSLVAPPAGPLKAAAVLED